MKTTITWSGSDDEVEAGRSATTTVGMSAAKVLSAAKGRRYDDGEDEGREGTQ